MTHPGRRHLIAAAVFTTIAGTHAFASPAIVTNGNDAGDGSLRAALESGAREIVVSSDADILINAPLVYTGTQSLAIYGAGQTIKAFDDFTLLTIANGANLTVNSLDFEGPGGFSIENQSANPSTAGKGIFVDVRDDQTGSVRLTLTDVSVSRVANHGVHVSDCDLADDCGGGGGGTGGGSEASIRVEFNNVTIDDVGYGKFDADGLRVDERDNGSIIFVANNSTFTRVGADGVELDEGQAGRVSATVTNSQFTRNGGYCDPDLLADQLAAFLAGAPDEAEFDESEQVAEADVPGPVSGSADDRCFEYELDTYDSGFVEAYEYAIDVDDGFDIDEAGDGSIKAVIIGSQIGRNLDEGLDLDEEDQGGISLIAIASGAERNTDDGFKLSEEDGGNVNAVLYRAEARMNGGKGLVFEEADNGSLTVLVDATLTKQNDDGDDTGIEVVQEDNGNGTLTVRNSSIKDGIDADGVDVIEE